MANTAEVLQAVTLALRLLGQLLEAASRIRARLATIHAAQAEGRDISDAELAELNAALDANSAEIASWAEGVPAGPEQPG
jgi:hypothetical protein